MGLDISHDTYHGAYSSFSRFRNKLAELAGYEIAEVKFSGGNGLVLVPLIDYGHIQEKVYNGEWDKTPDDPLIVLIAHSDCEGVIHPEQAKALASRLEELLPLTKDIDLGGHVTDLYEKTRVFIDGLKLAVEENEPVEFG